MRQLLAALAIILISATSGSIAGAASSNIETDGNILAISRRDFSNPIKLFLGPDLDHGLYTFVQERPAGTWAGIETFVRPTGGSPAAGYGALPLRVWGSNIYIEDTMAVATVVTDRIYLQSPRHTPAGAMTYDQSDLGTYIARDGRHIIIYADGKEVARFP